MGRSDLTCLMNVTNGGSLSQGCKMRRLDERLLAPYEEPRRMALVAFSDDLVVDEHTYACPVNANSWLSISDVEFMFNVLAPTRNFKNKKSVFSRVRSDQWYSTFFHVPPGVILFNFVLPKLLVYNSSYSQSIIYIWNKSNKLHPK
jgi:hypothetical protein